MPLSPKLLAPVRGRLMRCNAACATQLIDVDDRQVQRRYVTRRSLLRDLHLADEEPMTVNRHSSLGRDPLTPRRRAITVLLRPTALAAGVALILAAAGCGGGSKSTSSSASTAPTTAPAAPSRAEYVAKANAVCNSTNGPLAATALKLASHPRPVVAAHIIAGTFIPQIKSQLSRIKAIGTPAGGEATIATMDRLLARDIARIEKDPAIAGPAAFHDFAEVAHRYGLTSCAPLS
jgi:hypothetical protein